jgi:hypothetical protein
MEVCEAEDKTGTSILFDAGTTITDLYYEDLCQKLHVLNARLLFLDGIMNFEVVAGKFIRETFSEFSRLREERGLGALSAITEQGLIDFLDYHLNLSELRRFQEQTLQKRIQTQLGVVGSLFRWVPL